MPNPIHDPAYALFREMLTNARLTSGMLQSTIAEKLGKNQSFISKYERGERRLDLPEFLDIAEALEIDVIDFIKRYKDELRKLRRR